MDNMIIVSLSEEQLEENAAFISSCQNLKESFVAWLGCFVEKNTILALQRNLDQYPLGK